MAGQTLSPKQLGKLADAEFCPRCFWIEQQMKFKAPYSMFPGIFSTLDKYQKNIVIEHMKVHGRVPDWLGVFGEFTEIVPSPHWSKFSMVLPSGLVFRGASDTLLRKTDGSLFILDEKTAKPKASGHRLERMYDVQLNGYGMIAEAIGLGPVSGLGIVYNVPQQFSEMIKVAEVVDSNGYMMNFVPETRDVAIDKAYVLELIKQAEMLMSATTAPNGRDGCKNCDLIDQMAGLANLRPIGA